MTKNIVLSMLVMVVLAYSPSAFSQTSLTGQQRIIEPIIVNGQQVQGTKGLVLIMSEIGVNSGTLFRVWELLNVLFFGNSAPPTFGTREK